jgi:DNA-binding HxlR family transcriptional regulator
MNNERIEFHVEGTEKGLDLIPVVFEIMRWSAKYDNQSQAKRISKLMTLIDEDNRAVSAKTREEVQRGEGIVTKYLG